MIFPFASTSSGSFVLLDIFALISAPIQGTPFMSASDSFIQVKFTRQQSALERFDHRISAPERLASAKDAELKFAPSMLESTRTFH
jgi:hypothetical protein